MSTTNNLAVQQLYVAYFNRPADGAGLDYWTNALSDGGATIDQISAQFASSTEYKSTYAGMNNDQIVNAVYLNLFGRAADAGGLQYWSAKLSEGVLTLANVVSAVSSSAVAAGAGSDYTAITDKVTAADNFTTAIQGDSAARLAYSTPAGTAIGKAYLAAVVDDASLATAANNLTATVGNLDAGNVTTTTTALTAGVDSITGVAGNNVFNGSIGAGSGNTATLTTFDSITGGSGTNTLNISDFGGGALPAGVTLHNIQTINVQSSGANSMNTTGVTGLTAFNVTSSLGADTITAASTTAVTVADAGIAAGAVTIDGGSSVVLNAAGVTTGSITVGNGTAVAGNIAIASSTTSGNTAGVIAATTKGGTTVTIANTLNGSAVGNAENVTDSGVSASKAGTLANVALSGYTTSTISSNALSHLSLTNGTGNVTITDTLTTPTALTLALSVNNVTGGSLIDTNAAITNLNITTAGGLDSTGAAIDSTLANISDAALTALTLNGTNKLTLTSTAGMTALKTVAISGGAGLVANLSTSGTVTDVKATGATGSSTVTLGTATTFEGGNGGDKVTVGATTKAIAFGSGNDTLTLTAALGVGGTATGGAGVNTLSIDATQAATASGGSTFATAVSGFQHLTLSGATNQTVDLAGLGGYTYVTTAGGNGLTLSNMVSTGTLALTGAGTAYTVANSAFTAGTADSLNIALSSASAGAVNFASTGLNASGVEAIHITTADTQATPSGTFNDLFALLGNSATSITVAGNAGLTLTATDTALTSVNASGITGTTTGGFTFTSGALAAAATITGSVAGVNTVDFSASTHAVTYTGGTGVDNVTMGTGNNIVSTGAGADQITGTSGNQTVTVGNTAGVLVSITGAGTNNVTVGTGSGDTVLVGNGQNIVTFGAHAAADHFTVGTAASANTYSVVNGLTHGDTITFTNEGVNPNAGGPGVPGPATTSFGGTGNTAASAQIVLNTQTAAFADYIAAAVSATTSQGQVEWFQFGGNTYIVEQASVTGTATFQAGTDNIVELVGVHNLAATGALAVASGHGLTL